MDDIPTHDSPEERKLKRQWGCRHPLFVVCMGIIVAALIWILFL